MTTVEVNAKRKKLAPVDDKVKVPKQVQEAQKRAEAFYEQPAQEAQPEVPPEAETPAQPELPEVRLETPRRRSKSAPQPESPPEAAQAQEPEPPPAAPPPQPAAPEIDWKRQYDGLQARFKDTQAHAAQMARDLARLQQLQQAAAKPAQRLLTPEDEANYGKELIDFASRAAREAVAPQLTALEAEAQRLRERMAQQSQDTITAALDASVPNWQQIFADPRFLAWLNLPDIYSGKLRSVLLTEAAQTGNAARVVAFYRGFVNDEIATGQIEAPHPPPAQPPQPAPNRQAAKTLQDFVTPGTRARPAAGTPAPAGNEKPIITRAQIKAFYEDVRRGVYDGRPQEKANYEAMMNLADREGRVR